MNQIGLDIGTKQVKAVETKINSKSFELINLAKSENKGVNFFADFSKDNDTIAKDFLTEFVIQNGFLGKDAVISIPEYLVYSTVLSLPNLKGKDLENAIKLELEQTSFIPLNEASKTYQILPKVSASDINTYVFAVIAPNSLTFKLHKLATQSGLKIIGIEPESVATVRSLINEESEDTPATLVVNLGYKNTIISVYSDFAIRFTRTLGTGFENFIKAVSQDLKLESLQAEEYIKTYGFINDKLNGKIKDALIPIYSIILEEIKRSISFFETRPFGRNVKRVVLTGGGSSLPGLIVFTANYLGFEVQLGNSFSRFESLGKYKNRKPELEEINSIFSTSVGLSIKPFR